MPNTNTDTKQAQTTSPLTTIFRILESLDTHHLNSSPAVVFPFLGFRFKESFLDMAALITTSVTPPHSSRSPNPILPAFGNFNYCLNFGNESSSGGPKPFVTTPSSSWRKRRSSSSSVCVGLTIRSAATKPAKSPGICCFNHPCISTSN